ncbi:MAG: hypothetical protein EOQ32_31860 [Mesorhizobium sp.]|nr:MAG: hypothetical protein EOQ32_31860 [Mesorhizobium sp.]
MSRRLAGIPGVSPIGAALLVINSPAPKLSASGRQFAAWTGLTLLRITGRGIKPEPHHCARGLRDIA